MPRLSPQLERAVFFLYGRNPTGKDQNKLEGPLGTGVIVGDFDITAPGVMHLYAVTAAHVALTGASVIMLNTTNGKRRPIDLDPSEWCADLRREDIAAVDISARIKGAPDSDEISYIPYSMFASEQFLRHVEFGIGEDGVMLGLFSEHPGVEKNVVAARFGNVSVLSDSETPIERKYPDLKVTLNTPCHVFDMHSRPGFSGSPVFVYRTPDGDLRDLEMRATVKKVTLARESRSVHDDVHGRGEEHVELIEHDYRNNRFLKLFGIHVAQFHDEVTIQKIASGTSEKEAAPDLKDGDTIRFPGSMTIVVPAWEILELLERNATLKEQRRTRKAEAREADARDRRRGAIVSESKTSQAEPEADNPSHKEDFTSLLNAAATRKPPAGQT